jgi:hypothetical protein
LAAPSPRARGEGGVRGRRRRRCCEDCVPNAFDISQHFVIPETQDAVAMRDEPLIAHGVASALRVLATVDLDDEPLLSTDKIHDIRTDRLLTHEFESVERPGAKVSPKLSFGAGRIFPQLTGQTRLRYVCTTHAARPPHPSLSPRAGRGSREPRIRALASRHEARRAQAGTSRKLDTFTPISITQAKLAMIARTWMPDGR